MDDKDMRQDYNTCPCCEREFKSFMDYPLMEIKSVSVKKLEDVPVAIMDPRGKKERVWGLGQRYSGHHDEPHIVPAEVEAYFDANFKRYGISDDYLHSDGYIYKRDVHQIWCTEEELEYEIDWSRTKNISSEVKDVLSSCVALRQGLECLEGLVGVTVPTKRFVEQFGSPETPKEVSADYGLLLYETEPSEGILRFFLGLKVYMYGFKAYHIVVDNLATLKYVSHLLEKTPDAR